MGKSLHLQLKNITINARTEIISFVHEWQRISEIKYKFRFESDYFLFPPDSLAFFFAPFFVLFISSSVSHLQIAITFSVFHLLCERCVCLEQPFDEIRQNTCLWGMLIPFLVECCCSEICGRQFTNKREKRKKAPRNALSMAKTNVTHKS